VFLTLSLVGAGGLGVIALLGRTSSGWRAPSLPAAIALVLAIGLSALLARTWNDERYTWLQTALLVVLSALTGPIAWFFGASSGFAGVLALLLVLVGLLGGGPVEAPRSALGAWLVYATIALSQATVATLGLAGVLPDESLQSLMPPGHALWEHAISNAMVQGVYVAAFVTGRVFRRRYARVATELAASLRTAATRGALVEEAREGMQQALAAGRRGLFSGQTLGTYVVGELIGRGGHGEVYEGRDTRDDRNVAIKVLRGDRLSATGEVQRFLAEGEAARRVDSPHVPHVFHAAGLEAAVPFIAMERLVGADLQTKGLLSRSELVELIEHATAALEAVHASGQLHGDVHPLNLIATASGWKLIDFGASAAPEQGGLPRYAAPEKRTSGVPSRQSDLYELAACLYLAICGRAPFADLTDEPLARAVVHEAPVDPRRLATVSDDVATVLALGLSKRPEDRPADASELRRWFLAALDDSLAPELRDRARARPWSEPSTQVAPRSSLATIDAPAEPSVSIETPAASHAPSAPTIADEHRAAAWKQAYLDRVKRQRMLVLILCASGAGLLAKITTSPEAMWFALACISAMAVSLFVLPTASTVTWTLISVLSVGPAVAIGLHSAFAAIVALVVFLGGLFDPPQGSWWRAHSTTIAVVVAHTLAFLAITLGLVPDIGNLPVRYPLAPPGAGILLHSAVIATYIASHISAITIHARYDALVRRNEMATRAAIQQEALLATARAELERVAAGDVGGVLTNARIGSYHVGRLLGRGGMGEVYEVTRGSQRYALKVIRGDRLSSATSARRFAREATTLQRVESPYVARVIEIGSDPTLPFIVMELVDGSTLSEVLRAHGALAPAQVRGLIRDLSRGLEDVHRAGVVHRDIKPGNIVRTTRGDVHRWMLIDFGIARLLDTPTESTGNTLLGTPAFMAPELVAGRSADVRTDTFALGVVAYRALTGRSTWTIPEALAPRRVEPRDPCADSTVSTELGLVLRIALAPDSVDRFASASELAAAFDAAFDGNLDERTRQRAENLLDAHPWRS